MPAEAARPRRALYLDTVPYDRQGEPARLAASGWAVREDVAPTPDAVLAAVGAGVEALLVGDAPIDAGVIAALPGLAIVATSTVGVDHIDVAAARAAGVWVTNVPDAVTEEVATTTIALVLGLLRGVPFLDRDVRAGGWDCFGAGELLRPSTCTLGIVGLGRIGRAVAELARPLVGRVLAYDPAPALAPPAGVDLVALDALLAASDLVTLHAPGRPGAPPLIDAAALARMRAGAFLVNVGRGSLLDTDALVAALDAGHLRGAALDVLAEEPPAPDARVRRHPRLVVTPHAAFWSPAAESESLRRQADAVLAWGRGERPADVVVEGNR